MPSKSGGIIKENMVNNTAQDGIAVDTSDVNLSGNEVTNSNSENGAIYLAYAISDITIYDNEIHDNTFDTGKWGTPGGVPVTAWAAQVLLG